jgi:hypothetical protein
VIGIVFLGDAWPQGLLRSEDSVPCPRQEGSANLAKDATIARLSFDI